ncbi:hypothetical protein MMC29_006267 [Sticta canariensis]|nr:hypothetical protein [Sticta canariensis]
MSLSKRDTEVLSAAFQCIKGSPVKVDFEKLALLAGYKSANAASNSFSNIKKKLNLIPNAAAQGNPGPATPKGKGKAETDDENDYEVTPTNINPKKRGRKPKVEVVADGMEVAGSAPAPKKRATEGDVIGLGSETVVTSKPKKRGRKPKDDATLTPNPVGNKGANFWSENETPSDRDTSSIVKQEVADHDNRTFTAPINSNDVEATRTSKVQSSADEELKGAHTEPYEDLVNMYLSI